MDTKRIVSFDKIRFQFVEEGRIRTCHNKLLLPQH